MLNYYLSSNKLYHLKIVRFKYYLFISIMNTNMEKHNLRFGVNMEISKLPIKIIEYNEETREVFLPNTGVSYICNKNYYPVFLKPVKRENLEEFRKNLESQLKRSGKKMMFWTYSRNKPENRDVGIDYLTARDEKNKGIETAIAYHTKTDNLFLDEFLKRATELYVLSWTFNPYNESSLSNLNNLINSYLKRFHNISFQEYKKKGLDRINNNLSMLSLYSQTELEHLRETRPLDFSRHSRIFLGALASMYLSSGITPEKYFSELEKIAIFPIKGKDDKMFELIRENMKK